MNRFEAFKAEKDGLDVLPDLLRYASQRTPIEEIPEDDLDRMKWYGVFHRKQTPGFFMMRLRTPGGRLTNAQLQTIAGISREFGRGTADLTTRENIQLRWLTLPVIPEILNRLKVAGITTMQSGMDNVRNFIGCPLAGLDPAEVFDTTPVIRHMQRAFLGNHDYSNLPRKFNVSIAGCREDCGHAQTQDLGFVPATYEIDGRRIVGFNVLVGGAMGGTSPRLATPLDVFLRPEEVADFFTALLAVYRDNGPREQRTKARIKILVAEWGEDRLREEVEQELGHLLRRAGRNETIHNGGNHLGIHSERTLNVNYVGIHVPVGRVTADQLDELGRLANEYGAGEVRLTVDQNIVIPHVTDARLDRLLAEPLLQELRPNPAPVWRNLVCCTGNDYCHFSLIDTKGRAVELARTLEERGVEVPSNTRIHVSGCVHACGKHHIADIGLQGTTVRIGEDVHEAVHLFAGGRLGEYPRLAEQVRDDVLMEDVPDAVQELLLMRVSHPRGATRGASLAPAGGD
ncbi:MAG TPA: ferredoxin--nitrite reductase [Dehalococcoidia bacterium]|nr:ferredoxin--nitrite reductase [Dehalococcoidia bacterium]